MEDKQPLVQTIIDIIPLGEMQVRGNNSAWQSVYFEMKNTSYKMNIFYVYALDKWFCDYNITKLETEGNCPFCQTNCAKEKLGMSARCNVLGKEETRKHLLKRVLQNDTFIEHLKSDENPYRIKMALKGMFEKLGKDYY